MSQYALSIKISHTRCDILIGAGGEKAVALLPISARSQK